MINSVDILLPPLSRGFHLITEYITPHLVSLPRQGIASFFIHHTSAALTINENADPDVRTDFATYFDKLVPDGYKPFIHTDEGIDDMPAHVKASIIGSTVTIPIQNYRLHLGRWQGIYLCEFRNHPSRRTITVTIIGE